MPETLRSYGKNRTDFYGLAERLKARSEWRMGHMHATTNITDMWDMGQLPLEWHPSAKRACYMVYSYNTPIAWYVAWSENRWVVPDVKYSNTTTNHQGKITVALSVIDKV